MHRDHRCIDSYYHSCIQRLVSPRSLIHNFMHAYVHSMIDLLIHSNTHTWPSPRMNKCHHFFFFLFLVCHRSQYHWHASRHPRWHVQWQVISDWCSLWLRAHNVTRRQWQWIRSGCNAASSKANGHRYFKERESQSAIITRLYAMCGWKLYAVVLKCWFLLQTYLGNFSSEFRHALHAQHTQPNQFLDILPDLPSPSNPSLW